MAKYPVKMLKDEQNQPFVPLVSAESIYTNDDLSFEEKFATKLEADNLKEGNGIILEQNGNDTTISVDFGATDNIIDNLNTTVAGQGPLDARQGNVLKNMIPTIVDNLDSTDATKVLSANQGHELKEMSVPTGGATGQVLKKASDNDHELEWGDAADPNAIVGDGSIMKIVELTYTEYKTLESNGKLREDTEYHITDVENGTASYMTEEQIQTQIENNVVDNLTTTSNNKSLSANQGVIINDKFNNVGQFIHRDDNTVNGTLDSSSSYSHLFTLTNALNHNRIGIVHVYVKYNANENGDRAIAITSNNNKQLASIQCKSCVDNNTSRLTISYPIIMTEGETIYIDGFQSSGVSLGYELTVKILWFDILE